MGQHIKNGINYTGGCASGHGYSTSEQVVGTWIDGKTLYEKTIDMGSDLSIAANSWGISNISGAAMGIDRVTNVICAYDANGNCYGHIGCSIENDSTKSVSFLNPRSSVTVFRYVTLQYTKSSSNRSLSAPVTSQKSISEPLTDKTEVPTEEEKTVEKPETEEETNEAER